MKLTWKNNNKSSKKRSLAATSILRNLPFEHQLDHDEEATTTTSNSNSNTQLNSQELASLDSSDSSNAKKLALSFQAQGDKLAEVNYLLFILSLKISI
jgi:hypothetical protein